MRSGSARASIPAILPFTTVNPITENGLPSTHDDDTGRAVDEGGAKHGMGQREGDRLPRHLGGALRDA